MRDTVTRHEFLQAGIAVVAALLASPSLARSGDRGQPRPAAVPQGARAQAAAPVLNVDVSVDGEDEKQVMALLKEVGARDVERLRQSGLTGVEIVLVGVLVASALSNLVIKLLPLWKCGVVIDARGSRVVTEKNCDLGRGTVLVLKSDGTQATLHEPSQVEMGAVLSSLAK